MYVYKCVPGNVTLRVDSTWGVSQTLTAPRKTFPIFARKYYEYDHTRLDNQLRMTQLTAYDRYKHLMYLVITNG